MSIETVLAFDGQESKQMSKIVQKSKHGWKRRRRRRRRRSHNIQNSDCVVQP